MTPRDRINAIIEQEAARHGVCPKAVAGRTCQRHITQVRFAVMHRIKSETGWPLTRIARIWGMHRTTVLNGLRVHASPARPKSEGEAA